MSAFSEAELSTLSSSGTIGERTDIARKVAAFLCAAPSDDRDLEAVRAVTRHLATDESVRVRSCFADEVSSSAFLPAEVAILLARDVESVAIPILSKSPAVTDDDLIEIVGEGNSLKQVAIAGRANLTGKVSTAISKTNNQAAVVTLVENASALIGEKALTRILDSFGTVRAVQEPMVKRDSLPESIAGLLLHLSPDDLKDQIIRRHPLPAEEVAGLQDEVIFEDRGVPFEEPGFEAEVVPTDFEDTCKKVQRMQSNGDLTPLFVLRAACEGDIDFVSEAFARFAKLKPEVANTLLLDRGWVGLRSLFTASGIDQRYFDGFRVALQSFKEVGAVAPGQRHRHAKNVLSRFLTKKTVLPLDDLEEFLKLMGRIQAETEVSKSGTVYLN